MQKASHPRLVHRACMYILLRSASYNTTNPLNLKLEYYATNLWSTARPELSSRSRNANGHRESLMSWPGIGPSHRATVVSQWATCLDSELSARQYLNIREVCIAGRSTHNSDKACQVLSSLSSRKSTTLGIKRSKIIGRMNY